MSKKVTLANLVLIYLSWYEIIVWVKSCVLFGFSIMPHGLKFFLGHKCIYHFELCHETSLTGVSKEDGM